MRPPRSRIRIALVVVAVAVVVVILLSLLLLGTFNAAPAASPGALTFDAARTVANTTVSSHGAWVLAEAFGYDPASAAILGTGNGSEYPNCNFTSFTGPVPSNVSLPAFRGSLASGTATAWDFLYYRPSTTDVFVVLLVSGVVTESFELTGPSCLAGQSLSISGPLGNIVDSPVAVTHALGAGGEAFLTSHRTGVSMRMGVEGRVGWFLDWITCSLFPGPFGWIGNGSQFSVVENDTSGAIIPGETYNGTCGGPPPIGIAFGLGTPSVSFESNPGTLASEGCTAGDYCYSVPITMASMNVTPADLSIGVYLNSNGVNSVVGYAVLDDTGQVVVSASGPYTEAGGALWSPGTGNNNTLLTTTMRLSVDMGTSNPDGWYYELVVSGYGPHFDNSPYYAVSLYVP